MLHAEQVTFGGSALDRAAELRGDGGALAEALADPRSRAIVLWRGKPLVSGRDQISLVRLPLGHPLLGEAPGLPVLLGREEGAATFALDMSVWEPEGLDAQALGGFIDHTEQSHPLCDDGAYFAELRRIMTRLSARDAELSATAKALFSWHDSHGFCAKCGDASEVAMSGWQRSCPSCGTQHFPRTDPVVIMLITRGNKTLLGRSPGWPDGMYSCLAGFVEPGETLEAAVRREVMEEAGVEVGPVRYLASQPWAFPTSLMIGCQGDALSDALQIDEHELEDARWVSREEVARAFAGEHPDILPAREGAIAHFLLRNWLADRLE
jgi:NAD+ diphosphatase